MKNFYFYILVAVLMATGCGDSVPKSGSTPTKDQIRNNNNDDSDQDYCELYGWYGDGTCDDFCDDPDPDCDSANFCDGIPNCPDGYREAGCSPGVDPDCIYSEPVCGEEIVCQHESVCSGDAPGNTPSCPEGTEYVDNCDADDECEVRHTECGDYYGCKEIKVCTEGIYCPEGMVEVDECEPSTSCVEIKNNCDDSWFCQRNEACEAFPSCPADFKQTEYCDNRETDCEIAAICGYAIYCEKN